jgi:hypothetical protein
MQVNRLNEALRLSFGAMSGANLQAVDRVVRIVRELDRYHGFVAAERWGLPDASMPLEPDDLEILAQLVKRIRETPPRRETIESAPGNDMAPETPRPRDPAPQRDGALASGFEPAGAPPASPRMAPQGLEKVESAPGNGMAPEAADPRDVAPRRDGARASALKARVAEIRRRRAANPSSAQPPRTRAVSDA